MSAAPPCHKLLFQFVGRLLAFFPNSKQESGLWNYYFLQCRRVLGLRLSAAAALVSPPVFLPNFLVRFVTYEASLEFVATNASLLAVSVAISDVSCSNTTFSVVAAAEMLSK